jgi:hypothetical protein
MSINELSLAPEKDFIEEDERSEVIKSLTDDEEIDAALDLIKEKYDTPETKDTVSGEAEPKKPDEVADTSDKKLEDKTKVDKDESSKESQKSEKEKEPEKPKEFALTDEIIQKQPEGDRDILLKYKDKGKTDLAKAAANAVALKNNYLKDNTKAIDALTEQFQNLSDEDLVKTLVETQANIGKSEQPENKTRATESFKEIKKVELPSLPESGEMKKILDQETAKRLKKLYPGMPEDFESDEYREFEKFLIEDGGLSKANKFLKDLETATAGVKTELQRVIFAQTNLTNLYVDSPQEISHILTPENLPRLKQLNDDFRGVNNNLLEKEVGSIKNELQKLGISEKDLGLDLTLAKDENGSLFNKSLNDLMLNGKYPDPSVVATIGKVPMLREGQLVKKFIYENNAQILTALVNKSVIAKKVETEKLKDEVLNVNGATKTGTKSIIKAEDVKNITDDTQLDSILGDLKNKYK